MTPADALSAEAALDRVSEAGIHVLRIPTPFAVGRVNCYLLEDDPLTLIDTGPNSGKALDELGNQLRERGHSIEDLELIILTHQHIDHLGLVEILVDHSGAEVAAIDLAVDRLADFGESSEEEDRFAGDLMRRHGIPEEVVFALQSVSRSFRGWGAKARVTRPLRDGEVMEFRDRRLRVLHRPGHSPSDTVFWDEERRILFAADHLIAHISSNPLLSRPLGGSERQEDGGGGRRQALVEYLESLQ
ncbi:MAG TPA: MBL fold metallo-hydrolase, partial [Solirubrobacterales bacterium]|nr:MBL fold metallo-hydrolase [Solirubrobacterales bacterium]